jgi:hypothetical protein
MTRHQLLENIADLAVEINNLQSRGVKDFGEKVKQLYKASERLQNWDIYPPARRHGPLAL